MHINVYSVVILIALLLEYALGLVADSLNLRHVSEAVPQEFAEIYPEEEYARSQRYLRASTRFGLICATWDLGILLVAWFAGGFASLDLWCGKQTASPLLQGVLFIGILAAAKTLLGLPFGAYATFVLEQRFGFNRTRWRTFVLDRAKGLGLAVLLGLPLLAAVLWFFDTAGWTAWLWCWGITVLFSLLIQYVAPVWIMPLFNHFTPLEDGPLRMAILTYCETTGFPVKRLFTMDGSRRSSRSNAFVAGLGKHKRIALFDTLVEKHTVPELLGIVAHEVGHWKLRHLQMGTVLGIVHSGLVFYLLSIFLTHKGLFEAFGTRPSTYAGLLFFGLLYTPVDVALALGMNALSRRRETAADRFAAATTGAAKDLAEALKKLSVDNLSNLTPHPLAVILGYSHPPVLERVRALNRLSEEQSLRPSPALHNPSQGPGRHAP